MRIKPFAKPYRGFTSLGIGAEIGLEGRGQLGPPVADRLEPAGKEPEHGRLLNELQSAHQIPVFQEPCQPIDDVVDVRDAVDASRDGHAAEFHVGENVVAMLVAIHGDGAPFHASHAGGQVERGGHRAGLVLGLRDVRQEPFGVDVAGQSARRGHGRNVPLDHFVDEVLDQIGGAAGHVDVHHLTEADGHGLDLLGRHAAIGDEALVERQPRFELLEVLRLVRGDQPSANASALSTGQVDEIGLAHHLADDLLDGHIEVLRFAPLDEIGVLGDQAAIDHDGDAVLRGEMPYLLEIGQGERLAADQVRGCLHADEGDVLRSVLGDDGSELVEVEIAFEGVDARSVQRVVAIDFQHLAAGQFEMGLGGGEMIIHRDDVARLDEDLAQQVFGRPPLMDRHAEFEPEHVLDGLDELVVAFSAGIRVVGDHHRRQLVVAHRVGAAVGEHVDEDVTSAEQEGVVAAGLNGLESLSRGRKLGLLDYPDLVHLDGDSSAIGELDFHGTLL